MSLWQPAGFPAACHIHDIDERSVCISAMFPHIAGWHSKALRKDCGSWEWRMLQGFIFRLISHCPGQPWGRGLISKNRKKTSVLISVWVDTSKSIFFAVTCRPRADISVWRFRGTIAKIYTACKSFIRVCNFPHMWRSAQLLTSSGSAVAAARRPWCASCP